MGFLGFFQKKTDPVETEYEPAPRFKSKEEYFKWKEQRTKESKSTAQLLTMLERLFVIVVEFQPNAEKLWGRLLSLDGILKAIENGLLAANPERGLTFGYKNVEQLKHDLEHFKAGSEQYQPIKEALLLRNNLINSTINSLIEAKLLNKEVVDDSSYFHHQVIQYMERENLIEKRWDGSLADFSPDDYSKSEFAVLLSMIDQLAQLLMCDKSDKTSATWDDVFANCDFDFARNEIISTLSGGVYKEELSELLDIYIQNPSRENAIKLITYGKEFASFFYNNISRRNMMQSSGIDTNRLRSANLLKQESDFEEFCNSIHEDIDKYRKIEKKYLEDGYTERMIIEAFSEYWSDSAKGM